MRFILLALIVYLVAVVETSLADVVAPGRLGVGMGWMLLVGYAVARLRTRFGLEHVVVQLLTAWAAVTVWAAAVGLSARVAGEVWLPIWTILARAAGVGLYTAGVGLPVLMVISWIREPSVARQKRLAEF
jgi:hypothetical protein